MLNINIKLEEVLKFLKIVSGSLPVPAFSKQAKTGPLISGETVPLNSEILTFRRIIRGKL
jgi:hypothetical protein